MTKRRRRLRYHCSTVESLCRLVVAEECLEGVGQDDRSVESRIAR